jgi:hypothetical protein
LLDLGNQQPSTKHLELEEGYGEGKNMESVAPKDWLFSGLDEATKREALELAEVYGLKSVADAQDQAGQKLQEFFKIVET